MRRNISRISIARKNREQRFQIKTWIDKLIGYPAFILGNGPSINEHNLSLLNNWYTIGINRIFLYNKGNSSTGFDPTILFWQDISLWNTESYKIHNLQALKVARDIADPKRIYYNYYLKPGAYKFEKTTHILNGSGSSGPLAVQLAYAMGCSPIILLGMDCITATNGETDFYGNNQFHSPRTMPNCRIGLEAIKKYCPVKIINCSNNNLWEKHKLEDVLATLDANLAIGRQNYINKIIGN